MKIKRESCNESVNSSTLEVLSWSLKTESQPLGSTKALSIKTILALMLSISLSACDNDPNGPKAGEMMAGEEPVVRTPLAKSRLVKSLFGEEPAGEEPVKKEPVVKSLRRRATCS